MMETLADAKCSEWLGAHGVTEAPYAREKFWLLTKHYEQFRLQKNSFIISYIARCIVEAGGSFGEALLHLIDWSPYGPDQMAIVQALRAAHSEQRPLIETPGHRFSSSETDFLVGFITLAICYDWTAYVYFDNRTTFLCWEGAMLDFWTFEDSKLSSIRSAFQALTTQ